MSTKANDAPGRRPDSPTRFLRDSPLSQPALPAVDARSQALEVFAQWLAALEYRRAMGKGRPTEPFYITRDRIFTEQPDNVDGLQFPAIGMIPGRGQYLVRGLGSPEPDDSTATVDGLALLIPFDYQEQVTIEGWGSKKAERRSIVAAIEAAFGMYEGTTDVRLILPDYYGQVASFTLLERENIEDESVRGRRRAHIIVEFMVPVVVSARFGTLQPILEFVMEGGTLSDSFGVRTLEKTRGLQGEEALLAVGMSLAMARSVARATLGLTLGQSEELTPEYLLAVVQALALHNAGFETSTGRPPYSPGEQLATTVKRTLLRTALP